MPDIRVGKSSSGNVRGSFLTFKSAEEIRSNVTLDQQRKIVQMYKKLAEQAKKQAEAIKGKDNVSSILREQYLNILVEQLINASEDISDSIESTIKSNMKTVSEGVVQDQRDFLKLVGMPGFESAFSHVPTQIVQTVANGDLYAGNWTLSKAIWGSSKKMSDDINRIVAEGIASNKSAYEIAKDLETYVNPSKAKPWDWGKVYPGTNRVVDYNAQRLARTMVSHAYQQSVVNTCKPNPFVTGIKWVASNSARTCELCKQRDGMIYPKDDVPLDHPNGICTYVAVIPNMSDVADRLADWVEGKSDPAIDAFAISLYK